MLYSEELVGMKLKTCVRVNNLYDIINNNTVNNNDNQNGVKLTHFVLQQNLDILKEQYNSLMTKDSTQGEFISPCYEPLYDITNPNELLKNTLKYSQHNRNLQSLSTFSLNSELTTYPNERLVVQLGVGNAVDALEAANVVQNDCRAIDINLGCPKAFSTQGCFGSSLLVKPEIVEDIIKTLKRNTNLPITIKIRMLPDVKHTIELIKRAEHCGVEAIAVHARYKADRPRYQALPLEQMPILCSLAHVPLLYNGDIYNFEEIEQYKHICRGCWCPDRSKCACSSAKMNANGVHGVLIGRGAMHNPSVFGHYLVDPKSEFGHKNDNNNPRIHQNFTNSPNISPQESPSNTHSLPNTQIYNNDNDDNNNNDNIPLPPPIWDPISSLTSSDSIFSQFIPPSLYQQYCSQFTNHKIYSRRTKYPANYQDIDARLKDRNGVCEDYQRTPVKGVREGGDNVDDAGNFDKNKNQQNCQKETKVRKIPVQPSDKPYHLFNFPTWPTQNGKDFVPPNCNHFNELLEEIEHSIKLHQENGVNNQQTGQQQQPQQQQQQQHGDQICQHVTCQIDPPQDNTIETPKDQTTAHTSTDLNHNIPLSTNSTDQNEKKNQEKTQDEQRTKTENTTHRIFEEQNEQIEDYTPYKHRTRPYQFQEPSLNPWKSWTFGESYYRSYLIGLIAQLNDNGRSGHRNEKKMEKMLPMFYPTTLFTMLVMALSIPNANAKYIIANMVKCNSFITKDDIYRQLTSSKLVNTFASCLLSLSTNPNPILDDTFRLEFYHPQPIHKHELRPQPTQQQINRFSRERG
jgi:tRNA-dihydrouridine synthase